MGSARNANRKAVLSGIVDGMGKSEATYPFEQILTITIRQELAYIILWQKWYAQILVML
jgi:hypothetical protein